MSERSLSIVSSVIIPFFLFVLRFVSDLSRCLSSEDSRAEVEDRERREERKEERRGGRRRRGSGWLTRLSLLGDEVALLEGKELHGHSQGVDLAVVEGGANEVGLQAVVDQREVCLRLLSVRQVRLTDTTDE